MKYEGMIREIVTKTGGKENIISVYHCATRLRFKLKDESVADESGIREIDGVLSVIKSGGQFQVVIGQHVSDVYKELTVLYNLDGNGDDKAEDTSDLRDAREFKEEMKGKKISSSFIDVISGVFTPILGMMMATGVIKGLLALLLATGVLTATDGTYLILNIVGDCFFNFMPVFLGYTAMKKFGGTPFIGLAIGAALVYPSISGIMAGEALYTLFAGTIFESPVYVTFLGIPVILMNYASSVIPVIVICFFASKIEKFFSKRFGDAVRSLLVPVFTLLISIVLGLLVIGPVVSFLSSLLGAGVSALFELNATITGFLYGALIQVCVMFGVHWGFVAISMNNLATLGYDPITIAGLASAFGQAGVVLVIMLKTRSKKVKGTCGPALISAMFGITEPAVYGVTLQYKKPFILACIASGFGGAIIGGAGVKQYIYGINGVFGWFQTINPAVGFDSTTLASIIACVVSFVAAIILMLIFGKNSIPELKK